jgi:hypothetical protein
VADLKWEKDGAKKLRQRQVADLKWKKDGANKAQAEN